MAAEPLLRPGDTCWRLAATRRLKFLVDYQDYFDALRLALSKARRSIHILSWGFDPRARLAPDGSREHASRDHGAPDEIGRTLIELTRANPDLDARLLIWQSALPISATQDFFPHRAKAWFKDTGVRFQLDAEVPFGACHHQKVVVIDDALAFIGSGDITGDRWDTQAHPDREVRRRTPDGGFHPPRHEVMAMLDGPAAAALGELFRTRWQASTGEPPTPPPPGETECWPAELVADIEGASVGIGRTFPAWRDSVGSDEISRLNLAAIAAARQLIYLENQYFASPIVAEALAERLMDPDGPRIVLVSSHRSPSYFDRLTMDRTRSVALWRLKAADIFGRFHAFAPYTDGGRPIIVHAKTMVVDDRLLRIGSANLNNRSEGFDTECELALEAATQAEASAVQRYADGLAGHWLGLGAAGMAEARTAHGDLGEAMRALGGGGRLRPLKPMFLGPFGEFVAAFHIGDPTDPQDSWRPLRRRERLYSRVRAQKQAAIPTAESPPPTAGDPTPSARVGRTAP